MKNNSIKSLVIYLLKAVGIVIVSSLVGLCLLMAVHSIDSKRIDNNIYESAIVFSNEGTYPSVNKWRTSQLDNFTDSIMFLECGDKTDDSLICRTLLSYRIYCEDEHPNTVLVDRYINNKSGYKEITYPNYWHGYLVVLKPLLLLFNYQEIRTINLLVQFFLISYLCYLLFDVGLPKMIYPFVFSILILSPLTISKSLQYSSCFYIFMLSSIAILLMVKKDKTNLFWLLFLLSGICTAFFDFLTYPISTFGIPALFYLSCSKKKTIKERAIKIFSFGICWCFGYLFMWVNKWILATILTDINVIQSSIGKIIYRTSKEDINLFIVIKNNISSFVKTPFVLIPVIVIANSLFVDVRLYLKNKEKEVLLILLLYAFVSILPIMWYVFASNHSLIHFFYTNKALIVTLMSILFALKEIREVLNEQ